MKKFCNFRPLFVAFVCMLVGGLFVPMLYFLPAYAKALIFIALLAPLALFCFKKFKRYTKYAAFAVIPFVFVLCVGGIRATINENLIDDTYNAQIVAIATDNYNTEYNSIEVRDVIINGKQINRKITAYIEGGEDGEQIDVSKIAPGTVFTFEGNFKKQKDIKRLNTNNFGYVSINLETAQISKTKMTLAETIRNYIKGNLSNIKNKELAGLSYAVLFGNRSDLAFSTQQSFNMSGTAHLLAVSGLHVGFLITLLMFILKLCKAGRKTKLIVPIIFLALLMFLCAFSPSVVRASIIAIIYLFAQFFGKEKDQLSTLSFAGMFLLAINPFNSVLYSFLLSFACVFSILCLATPITNLLLKIKLPKWLASSIAVIMCVNLATIPLVALMNQELNLMAFVSNIFLIPLFSLYYMVMFALVLITAILPFASIILNATVAPYFIFNVVQNLFNKVPPLIVNSNAVIAICAIILIFILSRFAFLKPKAKTMFSAFLCLFIIASFAGINITYAPKVNALNLQKSQITVLTSAEGAAIAVVDNLSASTQTRVKKRIKALKLNKVDAVVYIGDFNIDEIKAYLNSGNIPLIIADTDNPQAFELFEYVDNRKLAFASTNVSEGIGVYGFNIYSFITSRVNAIIVENENTRLVFTTFIKSNKAAEEIEALAPDVVYAKFISGYVDKNYNLGNLISLSNVNVINNFNLLFDKPLKIEY